MKPPQPYRLLLASAALWCLLLLAPSVAARFSPPSSGLSQRLYSLFSPVCHQLDSRSLHLFGHKLGVCSRCASIYFAFLAGAIAAGRLRKNPWEGSFPRLVAAALPMAADVALEAAGLTAGSLAARVLTGSLFGFVSGLALTGPFTAGLAEAGRAFFERKTMHGSQA